MANAMAGYIKLDVRIFVLLKHFFKCYIKAQVSDGITYPLTNTFTASALILPTIILSRAANYRIVFGYVVMISYHPYSIIKKIPTAAPKPPTYFVWFLYL